MNVYELKNRRWNPSQGLPDEGEDNDVVVSSPVVSPLQYPISFLPWTNSHNRIESWHCNGCFDSNFPEKYLSVGAVGKTSQLSEHHQNPAFACPEAHDTVISSSIDCDGDAELSEADRLDVTVTIDLFEGISNVISHYHEGIARGSAAPESNQVLSGEGDAEEISLPQPMPVPTTLSEVIAEIEARNAYVIEGEAVAMDSSPMITSHVVPILAKERWFRPLMYLIMIPIVWCFRRLLADYQRECRRARHAQRAVEDEVEKSTPAIEACEPEKLAPVDITNEVLIDVHPPQTLLSANDNVSIPSEPASTTPTSPPSGTSPGAMPLWDVYTDSEQRCNASLSSINPLFTPPRPLRQPAPSETPSKAIGAGDISSVLLAEEELEEVVDVAEGSDCDSVCMSVQMYDIYAKRDSPFLQDATSTPISTSTSPVALLEPDSDTDPSKMDDSHYMYAAEDELFDEENPQNPTFDQLLTTAPSEEIEADDEVDDEEVPREQSDEEEEEEEERRVEDMQTVALDCDIESSAVLDDEDEGVQREVDVYGATDHVDDQDLELESVQSSHAASIDDDEVEDELEDIVVKEAEGELVVPATPDERQQADAVEVHDAKEDEEYGETENSKELLDALDEIEDEEDDVLEQTSALYATHNLAEHESAYMQCASTTADIAVSWTSGYAVDNNASSGIHASDEETSGADADADGVPAVTTTASTTVSAPYAVAASADAQLQEDLPASLAIGVAHTAAVEAAADDPLVAVETELRQASVDDLDNEENEEMNEGSEEDAEEGEGEADAIEDDCEDTQEDVNVEPLSDPRSPVPNSAALRPMMGLCHSEPRPPTTSLSAFHPMETTFNPLHAPSNTTTDITSTPPRSFRHAYRRLFLTPDHTTANSNGTRPLVDSHSLSLPRCYPTRPTQPREQQQSFRRRYDICFPRSPLLQQPTNTSSTPSTPGTTNQQNHAHPDSQTTSTKTDGTTHNTSGFRRSGGVQRPWLQGQDYLERTHSPERALDALRSRAHSREHSMGERTPLSTPSSRSSTPSSSASSAQRTLDSRSSHSERRWTTSSRVISPEDALSLQDLLDRRQGFDQALYDCLVRTCPPTSATAASETVGADASSSAAAAAALKNELDVDTHEANEQPSEHDQSLVSSQLLEDHVLAYGMEKEEAVDESILQPNRLSFDDVFIFPQSVGVERAPHALPKTDIRTSSKATSDPASSLELTSTAALRSHQKGDAVVEDEEMRAQRSPVYDSDDNSVGTVVTSYNHAHQQPVSSHRLSTLNNHNNSAKNSDDQSINYQYHTGSRNPMHMHNPMHKPAAVAASPSNAAEPTLSKVQERIRALEARATNPRLPAPPSRSLF